MSTTTLDRRTSRSRSQGRLLGTGLGATVAAVAATTLTAALARAAGVDLVVQGGEEVPVSGIGFITGVSSLAGVAIAAALLRWSDRPASRFGWTAGVLTAVSMVPPLLWGDSAATTATLVGLHLVAAAVVLPVLLHALGRAVSPG